MIVVAVVVVVVVVLPNERLNVPRNHASRRESRIVVPQLEFLGTASALFELRTVRGAPTPASLPTPYS